MIPLLLAAVVVVAVVSPDAQPSPTPPPTPLKEIGRIRAIVPCAETLVHANSAIVSALRNDLAINKTTARLRQIDLNSSVLARASSLRELDRYAVTMRKEATDGEGEIKMLRELAAADPVKNKDLKAFADALGGALGRQKRLAIALQRFTTIINGREVTWQGRREGLIPPSRDFRDLNAQTHVPLETDVFDPHEDYTAEAHLAADELERRADDIARDEGKAADTAEIAVTLGCNARRQMSLPTATP